jgi:opacity protein-like surface antigen
VDLGRYFGIELAYTDYQEFDSRLSGQTSPDPVSVSLSALIKYPLTNRFKIVGKIGWARLDTDIDSSNPFFNGSLNEDNLLVGLGIEYILSSQWRIRAGYEGTEMNLGTIPAGSFFARSEGNLEFLSAGLIWDI